MKKLLFIVTLVLLSLESTAQIGPANCITTASPMPMSMLKLGNYIYTGMWGGTNPGATRITAYDNSTPGTVTFLGHSELGNGPGGNGSVLDMETDGTYIYACARYGERFYILDPTNPASLITVSSVVFPSGAIPNDIVLDGNIAYVSDANGKLYVIDITNPTSPILLTTVNSLNPMSSIAVNGTTLYTASNNGIQIIDITVPASASIISTSGSLSLLKLFVNGNYLYVSDWVGNLNTYDISTPTSPILLSTLNVTNLAYAIELFGSDLTLGTRSNNTVGAITTLDITNPGTPVISDQSAVSNVREYDVIYDGTFFYANSDFTNNICIYGYVQCSNTTSSFTATSLCSYTVPSGDETYTTSGTYNDTIPNTQGCDSIMTITVTINPIADQTINTADFSAICSKDTTIELASSEVGVNYYLRDNADNSIISGPFAGTGGAITLNTGNISTTTTFNVIGEITNSTTKNALEITGNATQKRVSLGTNLWTNNFVGTNQLTIEAWVKRSSTGSLHTIVGNYEGSWPFMLRIDGDKARLFLNTTTYVESTTSIPVGTWTHIAGTYDGSNANIYVNGILENQVAHSANFIGTTKEIRIGGGLNNNTEYFMGDIADVRMWNVAKTQAEIMASKDLLLTGNEAGLIALYNFSEGSGTTTASAPSNTYPGTLINNPAWVTGPNATTTNLTQMSQLVTITINPIADQTVTTTDTTLCMTNTGTTVTTASSEVGVAYYLRDNSNDSLIDGPLVGTGSGLAFNTGVLSNTTTYNVYAKNRGKALDFDGVDDYITANNLLTVSNNFTYEFWAKPTGTIVLNSEATSGITGSTGQKYAVYPHQGGTAYGSPNDAGVGVSVGTNGVSVYEHSSSYLPALLVYPTSITSWTHIAIVCTNKQYTLYINGVLVKTGQTSLKANVHPNIGELASSQNSGIGGGDYGYYQGGMDDFRLWDYPRTPAEIQSSMLSCVNGSEAGLVAAYDFENGTGTSTAADKSSNNYNCTLINMDVATDWTAGLGACSCTSVMSSTPTVTVHDIVAPVADNAMLSDLTDECSVSMPTAPTATDNCSGAITGTTTTTFPITTQGTTVVTWTYDDGNGNTSTQTQNVVITDVTAPVADNGTLVDVTAECSVLSLTAPTATDNCSATVTVTNDATLPITTQGTTVVTWTYDDGNGNTSTQTQNVVITDVTAPLADNGTLVDVTAECSVLSLTAPTATDNCSATVTVTNDATLPITTQGTTVVTWTYDDGNGNTSTQTQNVVITDVTAPVADNATLSDLTDECSVSMPTAPTATDNCSGAITGTTTTTFPITTQGTTVVTWTYDDGNGNTSTQTQNVVITDVTAPVADIATLTDVTATCEVTSLTDPTATDNCSGTVTVTNDATLPINTIGTTVVTWTYDDGNGNTSTQTQNVIVSSPSIDVTTTTTDLTITANNTTATAYQWLDCNNNNMPISGETSASYTATVNGDYAVIVTEGSCSDTSNCVAITTVGVDELTDLGVSIYPNPNNGTFTISTTSNNVYITVYSVDGKTIINHLPITQTNQTIQLEGVESGVYFVNVVNDTNQKTIRLVVE